MHKWLLLTLIILVAMSAVGCKQAAQSSQSAPPSPVASQASSTESGPACSDSCSTSSAEGETVNLTFRLPKEALQPEATLASDAPRNGSPVLHLARVLGAQVGGQGACVVTQVKEGGLADQAGIKVGDVILKCNGGEPDCASTLDAWLYCGKEPGLVEMTLKRPTGEGASCSGDTSATGSAQTPAKETK